VTVPLFASFEDENELFSGRKGEYKSANAKIGVICQLYMNPGG